MRQRLAVEKAGDAPHLPPSSRHRVVQHAVWRNRIAKTHACMRPPGDVMPRAVIRLLEPFGLHLGIRHDRIDVLAPLARAPEPQVELAVLVTTEIRGEAAELTKD